MTGWLWKARLVCRQLGGGGRGMEREARICGSGQAISGALECPVTERARVLLSVCVVL